MAQTTNLNVSPYFDDFNADDNYYKVLFKPGLPVQARELTGLQSILQNQIAKFGQHVFKEGAKVIPGNVSYFNDYFCVELNNEYLGITVESYIEQLLGRKIVGLTSGVTAVIQKILKSVDSERDNLTLYVKYHASQASNNEGGFFKDGELLAADIDIISGPENSTFIPSGEAFASTIATNSTSTGSAFSISEGVYFIRGTFVTVNTQTILLEQYSNTPTGRVGLRVLEETINADEDSSLTDNSKGFNNFAAPGADRLKITCSLFFKDSDDLNDNDFVELGSLRDGVLKTRPTTSDYNFLGDELARRTFEESGDYTVKPFSISVKESLNNKIGNNGIYGSGQTTEGGSIANEDLALFQVSAGKAFVKGYEIEKISSTFLDVEKPRTTKLLKNQRVNYNTGATVRVNRVFGSPEVGAGNTQIVALRSERIGIHTGEPAGEEIGLARVYDFALESGSYNTTNNNINEYDISLFDIQTFTKLTLNETHTLATPTFVEGKFSGASGFLRSPVSASASLIIYETQGEFVINEPLIFDGIQNSRVSVAVTTFGVSDVKSIFSGPGISNQTGDNNVGFARTFNGDIIQKNSFLFGDGTITVVNGTTGLSTITSSNPQFPGKIKVGNLLSFGGLNNDLKSIVRVVEKGTSSISVTGVTTVAGVTEGQLPLINSVGVTTVAGELGFLNTPDLTLLGSTFEKSLDNTLYTQLPRRNVSNVDLSNTTLTIKKTFDVTIAHATNNLSATVSTGNNETFLPFDDDRYSLVRNVDGVTEILTSDKFEFSSGNNTLQINNIGEELTSNATATLIATVSKIKPTSKTKRKNRVNSLLVDKSKLSSSGVGATTLNDGLTFGSYPFGTRVQDKKISLNTPDIVNILGIFESLDADDPSCPKMTMVALDNESGKASDLIIGEKITGVVSDTVAIVAEILSDTIISFILLNDNAFTNNETIRFEESGASAIVSSTDVPSKNISSNYTFNNGQRPTIYNHGSITRKSSATEPTKKIKIYFSNLFFQNSDSGDIITANSYDTVDYRTDVQKIRGIRNTDIIDIRKRVSDYTVSESNRSPLEFLGRDVGISTAGNSTAVLASNESILTDFSFYLGRIDKIYLSKNGKLIAQQGTPAENPDVPLMVDGSLELATVTLPPFLYNVSDASLSFLKHKRYRMQDIRQLEKRIKNLEYYTTLSLLETSTSNLFVSDEDGLNKFKSGFFVDNFTTFMPQETRIKIKNSIDTRNKEARPSHYTNAVDLQIGPVEGTNTIFNGADPEGTGITKTGPLITLDYSEVEYVSQPFGTRSESVTPFLLNFWRGSLDLTPASDTWVDTVRLEAKIINVEGNFASTVAEAERHFGDYDPQTGLTSTIWTGWQTVWTGVETDVSIDHRFDPPFTMGLEETRGTVFEGFEAIVTNTIQETTTDHYVTGTSTNSGTRQYITEVFDQESIGDRTVSSEAIPFMRSRNIAFDGKGFRPQTRLYAFFDGKFVTQYCVPKLLQISMVSGVFRVGETVKGTMPDNVVGFNLPEISFKVASSNHKEGPFNAPTRIYNKNPYTAQALPTELETYSGNTGITQLQGESNAIVPSTYSSTSTILNVDIESLSNQPQGDFFGRVAVDMVLKGTESGAEAKITELKLVSDQAASIQGSFFIPDPNININDKFATGERQFKLTDSFNNDNFNATTTGSDIYDATGTLDTVQENIISTRNALVQTQDLLQERAAKEYTGSTYSEKILTQNVERGRSDAEINPPPPPPTPENDYDNDPLAQTFFVPNSTGVFLTSCEVFFETIDDNNIPVQLDIRTVKLGTPTQNVLPFSQINLYPDQIENNLTRDGSLPTKFDFKAPVYLSPQTEYAICMLSQSAKYRVFISRVGENDLITDEFVSNQPILGSLFKSQNASTWTPSQWEDLKFKLNRANFTQSGSLEIYNPILGQGNAQIPRLMPDSLNFTANKVRLGISSAYSGKSNDIFPTVGNTIFQAGSNGRGNLVGTAGAADNDALGKLTIINAGLGYSSVTASVGAARTTGGHTIVGVALSTITGSGRNAKASVLYNEGSVIKVVVTDGGAGYEVGDVLGITTSLGTGARLSLTSIGSTSEIIVDNVQGEFTVGTGKTLFYSSTVGGASSAITGAGGGHGANVPAGKITPISDGLHILVDHKNHGMSHVNNRVIISGAESDVSPTKLTADYNTTSTASLSVGSTINFTTFENISVASTNPGYVKIRNEIIKYTGFSGDTLTGITREQDSTKSENYISGDLVQKYELNGISLRRINNTHNLGIVTATNPFTLDSYNIKLDMGANGIGRSTSTDVGGKLFANLTKSTGGIKIRATQNMPFEIITPIVSNTTVSGTKIDASIKTVSGSSINDGSGQGSDTPFIVQENENVSINEINYLDSPRVIASRVNETNNSTITSLSGDRSFNMTLNLQTNNSFVSPTIDTDRIGVILTSNRVDKLITNFATDNRVDTLSDDPSAFQYVSKENTLETSATSLKIILDAHINEYTDLRAFYAISDNPGFDPVFVPFPGFKNLNERGQVISPDKSDGRSDVLIPVSNASGFTPQNIQYKEYTFSVNELPLFRSFRIKLVGTSTNQAYVPRFTSLKVIALA